MVRHGVRRRVRRLLREAGIPPALRDALPLLCDREGVLWVDCSPCERVTMVAGGPIGGNRTVIAPAGDAIEHAEFKLSGCESYVRLECTDASGKTAWTNALR